jgi:hypothetical protein
MLLPFRADDAARRLEFASPLTLGGKHAGDLRIHSGGNLNGCGSPGTLEHRYAPIRQAGMLRLTPAIASAGLVARQLAGGMRSGLGQ